MWAPCRELNPARWAVTNNRSEEKRISWVKECYALCHFLSALIWFHGPDKYHGEKEDIERERVSAVGIKAKKPWELFTDTSLRWQLLTLVVIHTSQQLNGINAVCISPRQQETTASHQWLILALTADVCTINTPKKKKLPPKRHVIAMLWINPHLFSEQIIIKEKKDFSFEAVTSTWAPIMGIKVILHTCLKAFMECHVRYSNRTANII